MEIDDLHLITEHYPPYNLIKNSNVTGISTDVLLAMLKEAGSTKSVEDIELLPWSRAYRLALTKAGSLLFSTTRITERIPLFKWVGPIVKTRTVVVRRSHSKLTLSSPEELKNYTVGAVHSGMSDYHLERLSVPPAHRVYSHRTSGTVRNLLEGKVDFVVADIVVAQQIARELGYSTSAVAEVILLEENTLYYAMHRRTPDTIVNRLQTILDKLKAPAPDGGPGVYEKILQKYGIAHLKQ